jgi:ribosomal protein S18 acetylase RimI-like enzyme
MRVRPASVADAPAVTAVRAASWRTGYAGVVPDEVLAEIRETPRPQMFDYLAEPPARHLFVVAEAADGTISGYCNGGPYRTDRDDDSSRDGDLGEIFAIYVSPTRWGQGVGQALLSRSLRLLFDDGFKQVRLWVLADNPRARRFYEAAGFSTDGATSVYEAGSARLQLVRYQCRADSA